MTITKPETVENSFFRFAVDVDGNVATPFAQNDAQADLSVALDVGNVGVDRLHRICRQVVRRLSLLNFLAIGRRAFPGQALP